MSSKKCENCNHIRIIADGPYIVSSDIPLNEYAIMPDAENKTVHGDTIKKIKNYQTEGNMPFVAVENLRTNHFVIVNILKKKKTTLK